MYVWDSALVTTASVWLCAKSGYMYMNVFVHIRQLSTICTRFESLSKELERSRSRCRATCRNETLAAPVCLLNANLPARPIRP